MMVLNCMQWPDPDGTQMTMFDPHEDRLGLRTAHTAPVWRGGTQCLCKRSGEKTGYRPLPGCTKSSGGRVTRVPR